MRLYSATVLAGVTVVYKVRSLTPLTVFLVMAAGAVVTGPPMLRWFKSHMAFLPGRRIRVREVMHQHWIYGRWALASAIVIWLSGAVYYPALGSFFSSAETGRFKALMNLGSPIGQAYVALSLLSLPYASQVHHAEGNAVVGRLVWKLTGLYLGGSILYWLIVILARGPIVQHLYGGKYTQVIALLPWVALGSVLRIGATAQAERAKSHALAVNGFRCLFRCMRRRNSRRHSLHAVVWIARSSVRLGALRGSVIRGSPLDDSSQGAAIRGPGGICPQLSRAPGRALHECQMMRLDTLTPQNGPLHK